MDVDRSDQSKFPTLEQFKEKYGTTVNYEEIIDDNDTFVGTIKPQLEAGQDTGWDLIAPHRLDGRPADPPRLGRDRWTSATCRTSSPTSRTSTRT